MITFSEVPTTYFLFSSPPLNVHFGKTYHISATGRTVYGVKRSLTFFLLAHEEVLETDEGQFVVG